MDLWVKEKADNIFDILWVSKSEFIYSKTIFPQMHLDFDPFLLLLSLQHCKVQRHCQNKAWISFHVPYPWSWFAYFYLYDFWFAQFCCVNFSIFHAIRWIYKSIQSNEHFCLFANACRVVINLNDKILRFVEIDVHVFFSAHLLVSAEPIEHFTNCLCESSTFAKFLPNRIECMASAMRAYRQLGEYKSFHDSINYGKKFDFHRFDVNNGNAFKNKPQICEQRASISQFFVCCSKIDKFNVWCISSLGVTS